MFNVVSYRFLSRTDRSAKVGRRPVLLKKVIEGLFSIPFDLSYALPILNTWWSFKLSRELPARPFQSSMVK